MNKIVANNILKSIDLPNKPSYVNKPSSMCDLEEKNPLGIHNYII